MTRTPPPVAGGMPALPGQAARHSIHPIARVRTPPSAAGGASMLPGKARRRPESSGHEAPERCRFADRAAEQAFGDFTAVSEVDLHVRRGEFLTLLGAVRLGQDDAADDDRRLRGTHLGRSPARRTLDPLPPAEKREFGMVFQGYALFPHMTVRRNVAYPLEIRKRAATCGARAGRRDAGARAARRLRGSAAPSALPGASSSGSRWRERSASVPGSSCSTKPLGRSTRSCAGDAGAVEAPAPQDRHDLRVRDPRSGGGVVDVGRVAIMNHGAKVQVGSPRRSTNAPRPRSPRAFSAGELPAGASSRAVAADARRTRSPGGEEPPGGSGATAQPVSPRHPRAPPREARSGSRRTGRCDGAGSVGAGNAGPEPPAGVVGDVTYLGTTLSVSVTTDGAGTLIAEVRPRTARGGRARATTSAWSGCRMPRSSSMTCSSGMNGNMAWPPRRAPA